MSSSKSASERYEKLTQREHILHRPDSYIGSTEYVTEDQWVIEDGIMVSKEITYVPGLYKIFDEILVNASDHKKVSPSMRTIKVTIEGDTIEVFNDGDGISVEIHEKHDVYIPTLIFGHLLTSSNFDDSEERITGGRNGFGAKLVNIYSTKFKVETVSKGQKFVQTWTDNMDQTNGPKVTKIKAKDYTKVTFTPDLEKFGMEELDFDISSLMERRVYDIAGINPDLNVWLNGEKIEFSKARGFEQYCRMYLDEEDEFITEKCNERWQVGLALSKSGEKQQISFVNGIFTKDGGSHVEYISNQIAKFITGNKSKSIKLSTVKNHMWVFVNCSIVNPAFDGQTKDKLTTQVTKFGSTCKLSDTYFRKAKNKLGILEALEKYMNYRDQVQLTKTSGKKSKTLNPPVPKLDDANWAGTKKSKECTLILTEGDSAKTLAVSGFSVVGRDKYGVFPLKGKFINVRKEGLKSVNGNEEFKNIVRILGLDHKTIYDEENIKELRYGKMMIMTDQDHDGSHIKGLLINMIDHFWPSLLNLGFVEEFITPIVKAKKGKKEEHIFYTLPEFEAWKETHQGYNIKYYKGLGTSTAVEAREYFRNIDNNRVVFIEGGEEEIDLAFSKDRSDDRKDWILNYNEGDYIDTSSGKITYGDFVNKELVLYSIANAKRGIPSMIDGLKPSQRKILYSCFKRNLKTEIKVAQLAGYVSEQSAYHHGEASLMSTIIGMAQNYVGSNNVNLLYPGGQFGTRLQGGGDASSPRYIFTRLEKITRKIFPEVDDNLLEYLDDDGQSIEPRFYVPIVPMILVNGAEGVGTGWSTKIPNYDIRDIVVAFKNMINGGETPMLHPNYRGFNGDITETSDQHYEIRGTYRVESNNVIVSELPIGKWTEDYKKYIDSLINLDDKKSALYKLLNGAKVHDKHDNSTDTKVNLKIEFRDLEKVKDLDKLLKISKTITTTNMNAFDYDDKITKYNNVKEILDDFYDIRIYYYDKRKEFLLENLDLELRILKNKVKFITAVINDKFKMNRKKDVVIQDLERLKYEKFSGDYNYLLNMSLFSLTSEKVKELQKQKSEKQAELERIRNTSAEEMWIQDLDDLLVEYEKMF